jgi:hypothetical protein
MEWNEFRAKRNISPAGRLVGRLQQSMECLKKSQNGGLTLSLPLRKILQLHDANAWILNCAGRRFHGEGNGVASAAVRGPAPS